MELDDQLAALAAGELDDDTARALRARAAADPALSQRLARHERLQTLLAQWEAPRMSADAVDRLDERLAAALDELDDTPLRDRPTPTGPLAAAASTSVDRDDAGGGAVVDLGAARERRERRRGLPGWAAGVAVAAALVAVVGTGLVTGGLPGASDLDLLAGGTDEAAEEPEVAADMMEEDSADDGADEAATAESAPADEGMAADTTAADGEAAGLSAFATRARLTQPVEEGELLALLDDAAWAQGGDGASDDDAGDDTAEEGADECVAQALERDTAPADGREVWRVATGSYADIEATFVVIRTPQEDGAERLEVLAYETGTCELLARDETTR